MKKFGLIGYPLKHSFSKKYFNEKFEKESLIDHQYELLPLPNISDLPELLKKQPELCGLNVTIPHKIGVMFYLDKISPEAKEIDAVNCIKIVKSNPVESFFSGEMCMKSVQLEGFNTDVYGFEESLKPLLKKQHTKALVLGNGGAARAVFYVLKRLGIDYAVVSRRANAKQFSYDQLNRTIIEDHLLIINTTPLGTFPQIDEKPLIPYEFIGEKHLLYDLVYNPEETAFLKEGKAKGAQVKNGMEMLHLQAEKNWDIWNS
ncbi:shikimate dehydrogenase [Olivibacter sp. SDN3]|uniref:shikimate dehydrogenase family protein n=1 Tax=Olivibacter sp. SDN3 TaxID=2764720 RepID=UPI001651A07B|nr:shikimate dehydrogenase [Olivibacter sp. SDN3]QNL51152.1 shikimate dehydrogenase [Olivibacter sp. SDN3]